MSRTRLAVGSLTLSAVAFIGLVSSEGYTDRAVVPTKNDRPTVGFGSTWHADGTAVRMGDTTTPVRALATAAAHIGKEEAAFRATLPGVALSQVEYDIYLDFTYNFGPANWASSSMRRHLLAGDYRLACDALLLWRSAGGRDCSDPKNWGPVGCKGVWIRQLQRHTSCIEAQ